MLVIHGGYHGIYVPQLFLIGTSFNVPLWLIKAIPHIPIQTMIYSIWASRLTVVTVKSENTVIKSTPNGTPASKQRISVRNELAYSESFKPFFSLLSQPGNFRTEDCYRRILRRLSCLAEMENLIVGAIRYVRSHTLAIRIIGPWSEYF